MKLVKRHTITNQEGILTLTLALFCILILALELKATQSQLIYTQQKIYDYEYTVVNIEKSTLKDINSSIKVRFPEQVTTKEVIEEVETTPEVSMTPEQYINSKVVEVASVYSLQPELLMSIIWHESRYQPNAVNYDGSCVGLMQISTYWHRDRAARLGVKDFKDITGNIMLGADYISELLNKYGDIRLVLMLYNMNHDTAFDLYSKGQTSSYARSVLDRMEAIKRGDI